MFKPIKSLVLGAGPFHKRRNPSHEETLVDIRDFDGAVDVVHDLNQIPWPFEDNTFDEIVAIHLVEHLDSLLDFMNEAWRVLAPGGAVYIVTPEAGSNFDLTHSDPTHVRCFRRHTWINYFTRFEGPKFGYTDRFWAILDLRVEGGCVKIHASPLKTAVNAPLYETDLL